MTDQPPKHRPAPPYHVEPATERFFPTFSILPNPSVLTCSRVPVARHIHTWEVATQLSLAPEMEGLLRKTRDVMVRWGWHQTDEGANLHEQIGLVLNRLVPEEQREYAAAERAARAALAGASFVRSQGDAA
jgi:hypothetical protein